MEIWDSACFATQDCMICFCDFWKGCVCVCVHSFCNLQLPITSLSRWMGPQRRESSQSCNFCLSLKCCHWAIVGFTHFYEHHEHRTFNSSVCWYARVCFRGIKRQPLRTNACVRSAGVKVAKTKWHVNSGRPTTSETLQTSYLLLSSLHEVICSPLNGTCFMSENNVVCLMISSPSPVQREALDTCIPSPGSVLLFYIVNAICQVKMRKKWGQHMGPPEWVCVCVCEIERDEGSEGKRIFSSLFWGTRVSSQLFAIPH